MVPEGIINSASQGMDILSIEDEEVEESDDALNPMDILLAIFLCCDPEVQQMLCKALFSCKLALPFIYSSKDDCLVMSSWSFRDILVQFRDENGQYIETSLVSNHKFPVVSFVRIGELPVSKSKLLNSLINDSAHETFFHRDCINGHARRQCSNGLVEVMALLPSKTSSARSLTRSFLAVNLRGDMLEFPKQAKLIQEISSIIVVFIDVNNISQAECLAYLQELKALSSFIVLFKSETKSTNPDKLQRTDSIKVLNEFSCIRAFVGRRNRPEKELLDEVRQKLSELMLKAGDLCGASALGVDTDETGCVRKAKELSSLITKELASCDIQNMKEKLFPLQELWMKFSVNYKKENSSKAKDEERKTAQKEVVRNRQLQKELCRRLNPMMNSFLSTLVKIVDDRLLAKLWLQWIRIFFDNASRDHLPNILKKQNELRKAVEDSKGNLKEANEEQLKAMAQMMSRASVGLENIFREAGQVYEALCSASSLDKEKSQQLDLRQLSTAIAKLLLSGVPLEILDGDAGNVPSTWISAILKCCQELVGDKKIYVISVLGLQSSGKSTLLNTMFGLKFAVSAGRCTRGAFLQLVPVESGMPFDYIAVIDTEGLRAPELGLDKHHHDNELATLVIGLGDVTIINIKGENAAEMKDILQIAIQAFIRMKMANKNRDLHRHCIFIHQNVPAAGAKELMQEATFKMQQTLDDITKEAAEGEGLTGVFRFGDVLEFNRDTDIFFLSDLWQGDPPMAPVNPGYSVDVQTIKYHLLQILDKDQKSYLGFVDFSRRVNDLWKAILSEDFVFSFRSSIELKAYNMLEKKHLGVTSRIEDALEDWLQKTASVRIRRCTSVDLVSKEQQSLNVALRTVLDPKLQSGLRDLESFFDENQYSEQTIQWKERKLACLKESVKDFEMDLKRKLQILCDGQRLELEQGTLKSEWESKILHRAAELAMQVEAKSLPAESVLQEFENLWQSFLAQFPVERNVDYENVRIRIVEFLRTLYFSDLDKLNMFLQQIPLEQFPVGLEDKTLTEIVFPPGDFLQLLIPNESSYSKVKANFSKKKITLSLENQKTASEVVSQILKSVHQLCEDFEKETTGHSKRHLNRIKDCVTNGIKSAASLFQDHFKITPAFEIKIVVIAFSSAYPTFIRMEKNFYETNSLKSKLNETKNKLRNMFENIVQRQSEAKIAADFCRDHMETVMKQAIKERMSGKLKGGLLNEIGRTKFQLIVRMLTDMAQRNDFASIIAYVSNSHTSALKWLTNYINKQLFDPNPEGETVFAATLECSVICPMISAAEKAARTAAANSPTLQTWIERFCSDAAMEIAVLPKNLQHVCQFKSVKVEDMLTHLLNGLMELRSNLVRFCANMNESNVKWHGSSTLYSEVLQSLWGCAEQCPFCSEPCCRSENDHWEKEGIPHYCIQHRPKGVDGVFWKDKDELVFETCEHSVNGESRFSCWFCKRKGKKTEKCLQSDSDPEIYHPYKEYKKYFPEWEIEPDAGNASAKFWSWFCWTFQNELKAKHRKGIAELPPAWTLVYKQEAIDSLRSLLD